MRRAGFVIVALVCALPFGRPALADPPKSGAWHRVNRVCTLIATQAERAGLPKDFFARLIWKESRFDPGAVSPAGAEGIAQFMPGTAKMRGLANPFDPEQAIAASATYLAELGAGFGNLGLAAAAYNAGEARVSNWLRSGGFLPLETEDFVLEIMGEPADNFADASHQGTVRPLDAKKPFSTACQELPVSYAATVAMATINLKPWGIQVAGNFRRSAAIGQWQRLEARFGSLLAGYEPVVSRVRTPRGRRGLYAVRIGADTRGEADRICQRLRSSGGACIVLRNR